MKNKIILIYICVIILIIQALLFQNGIAKVDLYIIEPEPINENFNVLSSQNGDIFNFTSHTPIKIIVNENFTLENGVICGDGSKENPYIIKNWNIETNGTDSQEYFSIKNTDAHFIISDCIFKDIQNYQKDSIGIHLINVTNGTIQNILIGNNKIGIWLENSNNIKICNNIFSNNEKGFDLSNSSNNIIENNNIFSNEIVLNIIHCEQNIIRINNIINCSKIIVLNSENNIIHHNNFIQIDELIIIHDNVLFENHWDNGYGEGNYWSNYPGQDNGNYKRIAYDGVGDTNLPHLGLDFYPLIDPGNNLHEQISQNISIQLILDKSEYIDNETITGKLIIQNNNLFDIYFGEREKSINRTNGGSNIKFIKATNIAFIIANLGMARKKPIHFYGLCYKVGDDNLSIKIPVNSKLIHDFSINFIGFKPPSGNYSIKPLFKMFIDKNSSLEINKTEEHFQFTTNYSYENIENPLDNKGQKLLKIIRGSSIGIISMVIISFFITNTEIGKYGFFSALAPLYRKQRKKKNPKFELIKDSVYKYIIGNPGVNYSTIKRYLNLPNGTLTYYLDILQKDEIIKSERDGFQKRFYPYLGKIIEEKFEFSKVQQEIYNIILNHPGISQTDISSNLGISIQRVNYNIQLLVKARIIETLRKGRKTKCFIINEDS